MSQQLAVWSNESDVYVLRDNDLITVVVNKPPPNTYQFTSESRYIDKLVELSVSGYRIPNGLFGKVD